MMMNRKVAAAVVVAAMLMTGCGRTDYIKEGVASLEEKEYESAIASFEQELEKEKNANVAEAYRGIGIAQFELEEYEDAVESLEEALNNGAKETAAIYNLIAISNLKTEQYEEAVTAIETGLTLEDCADALEQELRYNLIAAYEKLGEWEQAKSAMETYRDRYPDDQDVEKEAQFLETR